MHTCQVHFLIYKYLHPHSLPSNCYGLLKGLARPTRHPPSRPSFDPTDLPFEHGIVTDSRTPWQPMPMILIARPRNGLGMGLYEGRRSPGIRGAREPARSQRGPAPVIDSPTSITGSSSSIEYEDSGCSCCHARRTGPRHHSVDVKMTTLGLVHWMSGRNSSNINSLASRPGTTRRTRASHCVPTCRGASGGHRSDALFPSRHTLC